MYTTLRKSDKLKKKFNMTTFFSMPEILHARQDILHWCERFYMLIVTAWEIVSRHETHAQCVRNDSPEKEICQHGYTATITFCWHQCHHEIVRSVRKSKNQWDSTVSLVSTASGMSWYCVLRKPVCTSRPRGYSHVKTYMDVPHFWVRILKVIPKHGSMKNSFL